MSRKLTNRYGLPQPLVDAVKFDSHKMKGDISVTQIINPPQIKILKRNNDYEEDVMDSIWAIFGTACHSILEKSALNNPQRYMIEHTASCDFDGTTLSGTIDLYDKELKMVQDYKVTSVWSAIFAEDKWEWRAQQNIYAYMLRNEGFEVAGIQIVAILKDWNRAQSLRDKSYPSSQVAIIDIPMMEDDVIEKYIKRRIFIHKEADEGKIAPCSDRDKWSKATTYAVKKEGGKRAVRVFDKKEWADDYIKGHKNGLVIEERKGGSARCEKFCPVSRFCPQYAKEIKL